MDSNLPINPKTGMPEQFGGGGFLGKNSAVRKSLEASAAAEGHGKDERGKELVGITTVLGRMSRKASRFIDPVVEAIQNNLDSGPGLKQVDKLIVQTARAAQEAYSQGITDQTDDAAITRALGLLSNFIGKHTQFKTRIKQSLKNVVREKVQSVKQGMIDDLENSPSIIKRAIGRQLNQRFGEVAQERQKQLLEADAVVQAQAVSESEKSSTGAGRGKGGRDAGYGPLRVGQRGGGGEGGPGSSRILGQILTTDKGILKEVTKLANTAEETKEDESLEDKAAERKDEAVVPGGDSLKTRVAKALGKTEKGKKLGSMLERVTEMFSGTGGLMSVVKALGPALGLLGKGAAVAGAAFIGWEIGSVIAKFMGLGDSSKALAELMKMSGEELKETFKSAGRGVWDAVKGVTGLGGGSEADKAKQDEIDRAWERMGTNKKFAKKEDMSLDAARKFNQNFVQEQAKRAAAKAPAPAPTPAPAPAAPEPAPAPPPTPAPAPPERVAAPVAAPPPSRVERAPSGPEEHEGLMHISDAGLDKIRKHEGLPPGDRESGPYHAYQDAVGVWTIGHGLTRVKGKPVKKGDVISAEEEKKEMKAQIAQEFEPAVRESIGTRPVTQPQFDAMVSMAYNIGAKGFKGSTLAREFKAGREVKKDYFTRWNKAGGVQLAGLTNRRNEEYAMFAAGSAPAMAGAVPAGARSAAPVLTTAMAANAPSSAPTVINNYNTTNAGGGSGVVIPPRIAPDNENRTLRTIQSVNG